MKGILTDFKYRLNSYFCPAEIKEEKMAKKEKVQEMFDGIAPKYDLLNHLLSMGIDKKWRKKAMKVVGAGRKDIVLDVACGTGDFSIEALRHGVKKVVGADISENMLAVAREKATERELTDRLEFRYGTARTWSFLIIPLTRSPCLSGYGISNIWKRD